TPGSDATLAANAILAVLAAVASAGCSGKAPPRSVDPSAAQPAARPVAGMVVTPVPTTALVGSASPSIPAPSARAPAPAPSDTDACHVSEELERAYAKLGQGEQRAEWLAQARTKLLSTDDAERALTGITQEILSAIAHRRYDELAAFAAKDGICMRPARGADCRMLSPRMLAGCAASRVRTEWAVDGGATESPRYSCGEAFQRIFYARDFLHVGKPRFDCFPEAGRGNNASPIVLSGPRLGYVELYSEGPDGFRSLWLVFDGRADAPELVEMIADYPGI
ncbi:MAG TPA: hypothetical protein VHU80_01565, partial [Polyangiaceae bacterium]|nr:hypothetical protein [Polyangiaceae bacterium]